MVRRLLDAIRDAGMGPVEKLHDSVMIRLLNTSEQYVKNRRYNDILAEALEENKDEVMDMIIDSVRDERLNGLIEEMTTAMLKDLKRQIREEDQLK